MPQTIKQDATANGRLHPLRVMLLSLWGAAVVLTGAALTSQHQPIRINRTLPSALVRPTPRGGWRVVHVLSGSCGCSQRIMAHLALRHKLRDFDEEITVIDDGTPYLPDSPASLRTLETEGFPVRHVRLQDLPDETRLNGVPLLMVLSPAGQLFYAGGYGSPENDVALLHNVRAGRQRTALPLLGCVVGRALQRKADPFQIKYRANSTSTAIALISPAAVARKEVQ